MSLTSAIEQVRPGPQRADLDQYAKEDIAATYSSLVQSADQTNLDHLLSRQFKVEQADVIRVSFSFDSQEGIAFFDLKNSALVIEKDPFAQHLGNIKGNITQGFKNALARNDFTDAQKNIDNARKYKLAVPLKDWESELAETHLKFKTNEQKKHLATTVFYRFTATTLLSWIALAFVAQVGLATLLAFAGIARFFYGGLKTLHPDIYWKKQRSSFRNFLIVLFILGALLTGITYITATLTIQDQVRHGKRLTGAE
ncbi:MAG: hypothetical protein KF789_07435 [Bdellovibrionaceae bacterium]|nr:hypothetical protein [Pseudobdellovibrionaceae bacterium]